MTINTRTSAAKRPSMSTMRKTALVAGVLYLATFLSSIPAVFLQGAVFDNPNFILGGGGADTLVRFGALLDIVNGLTVSQETDGTTVISGPIADQAALHGVLQRVRDLGLPLVSVIRVEPDEPATTGTEAH